jgi:hypothetical protein
MCSLRTRLPVCRSVLAPDDVFSIVAGSSGFLEVACIVGPIAKRRFILLLVRLILLGFVLGPRLEENFRRSMLISRGNVLVFLERPISAFFLFLCVVLLVQIYVRVSKPRALAPLNVVDPETGRGKVVVERPAE